MNIKSIFSKMFRRRFVHSHFKAVKNNQFFMHEGRKFQKLDSSRACTTSWPIMLRVFDPNSIVISIFY